MTIRIQARSEGRCRLVVDGNMTIYEAAADKPVLLEALRKARETEIDLSSVREMDTAGLQLLILAKREATSVGKIMRLTRHSPASLEVLDRYNLAAYFGDQVATVSRGRKKSRGGRAKRR